MVFAFLQTHDVRRIHTFQRVAGIHDQPGAGGDPPVIERRMVGDDHGAIRLAGHALGLRVQIDAIQLKPGHIRVAVRQARPAALEQQHHVQGRRFPHVVYILLICDAQDVNVRTLHRLARVVERVLDFVHHKVRHLAVDVAGQFDEARLDPRLLGLP